MTLPMVSPDDIRDAAYGTQIPNNPDINAQLSRLIAKAGRLILDQVKNLEARLAAGKITEDNIADVIEAMVVRVVRNPNSYRQVGIDDFQATIDSSISAGGLYLSDEERSRLRGAGKPRRFGSARLALPAWRSPSV